MNGCFLYTKLVEPTSIIPVTGIHPGRRQEMVNTIILFNGRSDHYAAGTCLIQGSDILRVFKPPPTQDRHGQVLPDTNNSSLILEFAPLPLRYISFNPSCSGKGRC
jgi:hypothetical protein